VVQVKGGRAAQLGLASKSWTRSSRATEALLKRFL
jgi:hypothetical protein